MAILQTMKNRALFYAAYNLITFLSIIQWGYENEYSIKTA